MKKEQWYAVYRGDDFVTVGTLSDLVAFLKVKKESVQFMSYPSYHKRKKADTKAILVYKLED